MNSEKEIATTTNALINETSPYLLQHAHNPVNWYPWSEQALEKAKTGNKLIIVSIGYSACHWCHVMERESFENEEAAKIMNEHFICIKVDREERPDIDQVYMNAVQLMTGSGGWPLNCFLLPDGRPVYGGTYFPLAKWKEVLLNLANLYKTEPAKVEEYAEKLTEGIKQSELVALNPEKPEFTIDILKESVEKWAERFDNTEGGPNQAPKFPLPNNYQFLLRYGHLTNDAKVLEHVNLTLSKMAQGGIYDQVGGGFSRYSTDMLWKAPHFEKMLYDNAQLVSLYAEAYQATKTQLYKEVVYETLEFVKRELTASNGAFYSALDADSEGEEGKYYVWKKEELKTLLGEDFNLIQDYYNVNQHGLWEDNYILLRRESDEAFAKKHKMSLESLQKKIREVNSTLLKAREKRIKPGLDDKSLTSWNALMLQGYIDAYKVFSEPDFLDAALKSAEFITVTQRMKDGGLFHNYKNNKSNINGYLEDYCFTIEALLSLHEATLDEKWLREAKELMQYSLLHFFDEKSGMFFFTSDTDQPLIARKMEVTDNVIPASNSSLAKSLFYLGHHFDETKFMELSSQMLNNVKRQVPGYGAGFSNWGMLMLHHIAPFYEIVIVGDKGEQKRKEFGTYYIPNKIIAGSLNESKLPLLENKFAQQKTMIYVCINKSCKLPVEQVSEAAKQIQN